MKSPMFNKKYKYFILIGFIFLSFAILDFCNYWITTSFKYMAIKNISHTQFNNLLVKYVNNKGNVDYAKWHKSNKDINSLDNYLRMLTNADPENHPTLYKAEHDKLNYWVNVYNAIVIREVLRHYPLTSVRNVKSTLTSYLLSGKGFFYDTRYVFGNKSLNLKEIEDNILRKKFNEPRIHFVINCASTSCPVIQPYAFDGISENNLQLATRQFINNTDNVKVDLEEKIVYLSSIFNWYLNDFVDSIKTKYQNSEANILDFIILYANDNILKKLKSAKSNNYKIKYLDYDWSLN